MVTFPTLPPEQQPQSVSPQQQQYVPTPKTQTQQPQQYAPTPKTQPASDWNQTLNANAAGAATNAEDFTKQFMADMFGGGRKGKYMKYFIKHWDNHN